MHGVFYLTEIEWRDWLEGPSELTFCMTEGAELSDATVYEALSGILSERFGREVARMVVSRSSPRVVSMANRFPPLPPARKLRIAQQNLAELHALNDDTPLAEYEAVIARVQARTDRIAGKKD
jgi:hypothetical protein